MERLGDPKLGKRLTTVLKQCSKKEGRKFKAKLKGKNEWKKGEQRTEVVLRRETKEEK